MFWPEGKVSSEIHRTFFEILQRAGLITYCLALLPSLQGIHDVLYVFNLRQYVPDLSDVIQYMPLQLKENFPYIEEPVKISDRNERTIRNRTIPFVKAPWKHQAADAAWEPERVMREKYPTLFEPNM